jgi:antitoxin FitA
MAVNISIKNVPEELALRLKERAAKNHRSLQGELMAIIEDATKQKDRLTIRDLLAEGERLGLRTPAESAAIIRADRDAEKHGR